jgi:hypothetical protein
MPDSPAPKPTTHPLTPPDPSGVPPAHRGAVLGLGEARHLLHVVLVVLGAARGRHPCGGSRPTPALLEGWLVLHSSEHTRWSGRGCCSEAGCAQRAGDQGGTTPSLLDTSGSAGVRGEGARRKRVSRHTRTHRARRGRSQDGTWGWAGRQGGGSGGGTCNLLACAPPPAHAATHSS